MRRKTHIRRDGIKTTACKRAALFNWRVESQYREYLANFGPNPRWCKDCIRALDRPRKEESKRFMKVTVRVA